MGASVGGRGKHSEEDEEEGLVRRGDAIGVYRAAQCSLTHWHDTTGGLLTRKKTSSGFLSRLDGVLFERMLPSSV